jgi:phosphoglycolate phosphatase-like HAD superfamily hydrolase
MLFHLSRRIQYAPGLRILPKRWHGDCSDHLTISIELDALLDLPKSLKPNVLKTLDCLQEEHHNIVLISSFSKYDTSNLFKNLGLKNMSVCCSDSIPVKSPNPGLLIHAIETIAGGELANSICVGQSTDFLRMAKAAGVPVINIKSDFNGLSSTADLRIDSFGDVLEGIRTLKDSSMY